MKNANFWASRLLLAGLTTALGACSVFESDRIDYKSSSRGVSLEVPPDLTQLPGQGRYVVPGSTVTASGYQVGQAASVATGAPVASSQIGDVRFERAGTERWLVVDRPPEKLWGPLRDFWQESGFLLAIDQANLGIMETDWAENRAKIPQDFIRSTIGKALDALYSTGERDKFRTRIERNAQGGSDVYITHRGMSEQFTTSTRDRTIWAPRPADPELEAEFLRRLMVKLGVNEQQAKAAAAASNAAPAGTPRVVVQPSGQALQLNEGFDRAWRRVGLALDRTGFTVEDRDRSKGVYFVRYVDPRHAAKEPGFFGKLFGSAQPNIPTVKYQITVQSQGEQSAVAVLDAAGAPVPNADAQRIVQILAAELR